MPRLFNQDPRHPLQELASQGQMLVDCLREQQRRGHGEERQRRAEERAERLLEMQVEF